MKQILVIRLGALGDFVLSFGPFAAIRAHHPHAEITLLTTAPFAELGRRAPWFDRVLVDERPALWNFWGLWRLRRRLHGFDFVYDLQTSGRTARYFKLAGAPPWSGHAPGSSHRQGPHRETMHTLERQRDQLRSVGIVDIPRPQLGWLIGAEGPRLASPYALLVPGASPHRPQKRWPAARFGALATELVARGLVPVVVGSAGEAGLAADIAMICPEAIDLTGQTSLAVLFGLADRAQIAIGNDTGPMHIAASVGCPSVVLFSAESDPTRTSPRAPDGGWPDIIRRDNLADLDVATVVQTMRPR